MSQWTASRSHQAAKTHIRRKILRNTTAMPAAGPNRAARCRQAGQPLRLHDRACRTAGQVRTGRVLDRRRHRRDHGWLVGHGSDLFRVPGRCVAELDRASGRAAIRLRGPHRRIARPDRPHHQPSTAGPGAIRAKARRPHAPSGDAGVARHRLGRHRPIRPQPARSATGRDAAAGKTADQRSLRPQHPTARRRRAGTRCRRTANQGSGRRSSWRASKLARSRRAAAIRRRCARCRTATKAKPARCAAFSPSSD